MTFAFDLVCRCRQQGHPVQGSNPGPLPGGDDRSGDRPERARSVAEAAARQHRRPVPQEQGHQGRRRKSHQVSSF